MNRIKEYFSFAAELLSDWFDSVMNFMGDLIESNPIGFFAIIIFCLLISGISVSCQIHIESKPSTEETAR